jgi:jasmonate ZIM domain-containing protein
MTISYGGRVLVLEDVPADRAAELLRLAAAQAGAAEGDLPVARKASLQRFMEKRRCRAAARGTAPYSRPDADADVAAPSSFPDHLKLAL